MRISPSAFIAALAAFAVFWLIFDAWLERRRRIEAVKWAGFGLLAIGFLVSAATLEQRSLIPGVLAAQVAGFAFGPAHPGLRNDCSRPNS